MFQVTRLASVIALTGVAISAHATNGYFTHATSVKAQGVAGVATALAHDSLTAAVNPAAIGNLSAKQQLDLGVTYFKPERESRISGNNLGPAGSLDGLFDGNDTAGFWMPEVGFARQHSEQISYGIALYGNGAGKPAGG
ncbi:hypothetical protein GJQ54_00150 [Oceanospirillaceae bacterium ASx5O]|nr:hypothetical protein GJQ54_00150 [Oceanospirillaceae bacterium ASx5O]